MCGCSSLGCRVRVDLIGRDCELEISEILLMMDPREMGRHSVGRKVMLPERENTRSCYHEDL